MAIVSGVGLLGLMALTVFAVFMRKVINDPIMGTQDLSEAGLTVVVFFGLAYSGWTGGHIAVDLISGALKPRTLRAVDTIVRLVCGVFFIVVAWQSVKQGMDALEFGDGFNLLDIPHYPFFFVVAFGSTVYALVLFVLAVRAARGLPEIKGP